MAKNVSMSKEQLTDQIRDAISPLVERYAAQKSQRAIDMEKQAEEIELMRKKLGEDSPAYKALQGAIDMLEADPGADRKQRLEDASLAVVAAGNDLGLKLRLRRQPGRTAGKTSGRRTRMSSADSADMAEKVLGVLPPPSTKTEKCMSKEDIAQKTGIDSSKLQSVLLRLKREGKAESNGKRGLAGGWRRAA